MEPIKVANSSSSRTLKKSKKNMSLRRKAEALLRLASASKSDDKSPSASIPCHSASGASNVAKVVVVVHLYKKVHDIKHQN